MQTAKWKEREFWITIVVGLLGLCVGFGIITPEAQEVIAEQAGEIYDGIVKLAGFVTTALVAMGFSISRGQAKSGK